MEIKEAKALELTDIQVWRVFAEGDE